MGTLVPGDVRDFESLDDPKAFVRGFLDRGWTFFYSPVSRFVEAVHANGRGRFSVCEIRLSRCHGDHDADEKIGKLIAKALNDIGRS
jgi:hypothetical protein